MSSCRLLVRRRTNDGGGALEIELEVDTDAEVDVEPYGEVYAETECKMD